jgi:hypothetical protein
VDLKMLANGKSFQAHVCQSSRKEIDIMTKICQERVNEGDRKSNYDVCIRELNWTLHRLPISKISRDEKFAGSIHSDDYGDSL